MSNTAASFPQSHPIIAELTSLKQQLAQYQKSAHQAGSQTQKLQHELQALREVNASLKLNNEALQKEADTLRQNPSPSPVPPAETALSELSLAHRRLSAKLDLTESSLSSSQLELAAAKQEIHRLNKQREADQARLNDYRRIEDDREEEISWHKGERKKAEEQKKLSDLALQEYSTLVHSLDPSAVPPSSPRSSSPGNILQSTPDLSSSSSTSLPSSPASNAAHTTSESISNLLIGQRGVSQLFNDFTTTLTTKERVLHETQARIEELEHTVEVLKDQLAAETSLRTTAQEDRAKIMRDDASAAKVVERYMTFTQKSHATVHSHLDNLRKRSTATQEALRKELNIAEERLQVEMERNERLRLALDEIGEDLARETAGRRREITLRLSILSEEEKRERRIEIWLDRVRKARDGAEGAVLEPDILETLLDESIEAVVGADKIATEDDTTDLRRRWKKIFNTKPKKIDLDKLTSAPNQEASVVRMLMAEELAKSLVGDLQIETDRRMDLERQRVALLASRPEEAPDGDDVLAKDGLVFSFDLEDPQSQFQSQDNKEQEASTESGRLDVAENRSTVLRTPSPLLNPSPLIVNLQELFKPLTDPYHPLQERLHDLSHSLATIRSDLANKSDATLSPAPRTPQSPRSPISPRAQSKMSPFLALAKRSTPRVDPNLTHILDSIHEVIEDARVDVEIALADEERVYRGFEALLSVEKSGAVQAREVIKDVNEYIADRKQKGDFERIEKRVGDVEMDLMIVKGKLHEIDGMMSDDNSPEENEKRGSVWENVDLKTVTVTGRSHPSSPLSIFTDSNSGYDPRRRTSSMITGMGNVGRSFSSSVIGAPKRMGSFASGLYSGKVQENKGEKEGLLSPVGLQSPIKSLVDDVE